jgi:hypothetical protein
LWVIFALLDPDPDLDSESGSGSTDPIESGSATLVLSTVTVVVTATPAIEELNEGILVFPRRIVNRVETNMLFFLFAKIRNCVYFDKISRNFAFAKILISTKIVPTFLYIREILPTLNISIEI